MLTIWNLKTCNLTPFKTNVGILLEGRIQGFTNVIRILNIYAPYKDRRVFWENVEDSGVRSMQNLIVVGDLNFTMFSYENRGMMSSVDPLDSFFQYLFSRNKLIHNMPHKLSPKWRHKRLGVEGIRQRIDSFFCS